MQTLGVYIYFNIHVCLSCIFYVFSLAENSSIFYLKMSFFQLLYFNCISASWPPLCYYLPKVAPLLKWESFLSPDWKHKWFAPLLPSVLSCPWAWKQHHSPLETSSQFWPHLVLTHLKIFYHQSVKTVRQSEKQMSHFVLMPFSGHLRPSYIYKNTSNYC